MVWLHDQRLHGWEYAVGILKYVGCELHAAIHPNDF